LKQAGEDVRQIAEDKGKTTETAAASDAIETVSATVPDEVQPGDSAPDETDGTFSDIIEMKNTDAFSSHKMGIVMFDHQKHAAAEPEGYGIACGQCHHDENGEPLTLKKGDPVLGCMDCHEEPGKPRKSKEMSKEEWETALLDYYYGAIHANCIDCHKAGGAGPVKCADCHPKPQK